MYLREQLILQWLHPSQFLKLLKNIVNFKIPYTIIAQNGQPNLRRKWLGGGHHTMLSINLNPLASFNTIIWHYCRSSAIKLQVCHKEGGSLKITINLKYSRVRDVVWRRLLLGCRLRSINDIWYINVMWLKSCLVAFPS